MDWKTSNSTDGSEFRKGIGLQFFAEDGAASDTSADTDGFNGDAFLAALDGETEPENQRNGTDDAGEETEGEPENQRNADTEDESDEQTPEEGEQTPQEPAVQTVPFKYNGNEILLPAEAVNALQSALGANPVELLQKGMNYDAKGAREFRLLDQYASAAGLNRAQYLEQLEQAQNAQMLASEIDKCREQFPDTPDEALQEIAQGRLASRRAAEQQEQLRRQQELTEMQQRIDRTMQETRKQAEIKAWDEYEGVADVHSPEDIPPRVMELVQGGMTPIAAHWQYQAELAQQQVRIEQKNNNNRQTSPGSMTGNEGDVKDPFLRGFLGM